VATLDSDVGTRARFADAFLPSVSADGPVAVAEIRVQDVVDFVAAATHRYQPRTVELVASALRSFFGSCARRGYVATGWRMRSRWSGIARPVLFAIWIQHGSSS
jgi:hypothetical protein